jgi:hypothetical protein
MLGGDAVCVPLPGGKYQLVYVDYASVLVPYVNANICTPTKVEQIVSSQSTIYLDRSYVVPATIALDGLIMTSISTSVVIESQWKYGLLYFGFMAQW